MTKSWKCDVCGYIHHGPQPPETCPVCGVGADQFSAFLVTDEVPKQFAPEAWRCTVCDYVHEGPEPPEVCPICYAPASMFQPMEEVPADAPADSSVRRLVVVGAGIAGFTAARQARRAAPELEITLLSKEPGPPYYRLSLTPFLGGLLPEESLPLKPEGWLDEQEIKLLEGEVASIDREGKKVLLADGSELLYDRLILANGAHPFVPPIPGATREGVATLRTLEDARRIIQRVEGGSARCVCVGGGLLGLEVAGGLLKRGAEVTVLEGFDRLLPRQLAAPAAALLKDRLEREGLTVRTGVVVKELLGDEAVAAVGLESGEEISADLVIVSTGVRPNSYLARQAELEVRHGVLVDDGLHTSDPDILAAGDVAEHEGVLYGLWSAAYAQGQVAGTNAAGGEARFAGMSISTRLKVLDLDLFSIGTFEPEDASYLVFEREEGETYLRLVVRDGRVVGANLYGDASLAGLISDALEGGTQLEEARGLLEKVPGLKEWAGL